MTEITRVRRTQVHPVETGRREQIILRLGELRARQAFKPRTGAKREREWLLEEEAPGCREHPPLRRANTKVQIPPFGKISGPFLRAGDGLLRFQRAAR